MSDTLTPTEELVMEVLAARYRNGEKLWTFRTRERHALESLAKRGLVETMHGIVEGTIRASLTQAGRSAMLSETYKSPSERCVFCELAETTRENPASNRAVFVVEDRNPKAEVHLLVIPRKHVETLNDAELPLLAALMQKAREVGQEAGPNGYRVIVNVGAEGKQKVPHLHVHVLAGPEVMADGFARGVE